jgi:hypothetical protein
VSIWLLFGRDVDEFDNLDDALNGAWAIDEWSDDGWWDRIERIDDDGTITVIDSGSPEYVAFSRQRDAERRERERLAPPPALVGSVLVDGMPLESYYGDTGESDAAKRVERLRPYLGDRVKWRPVIRRHG